LKKKIYYWSPHLTKIATARAVINSAYSVKRYGNNYECSIINFFGEFEKDRIELIEKKINLINHYSPSIKKLFPVYGKIKSRFSFILIFLLGFFPLKKLISKNNPDYLIIHLITSLPLFQLIIFNYKTNFILRISGKPRLNILRKFFWKLALKKIYAVSCPTKSTYEYIKKLNIVDDDKLKILYDPILDVKKISNKKKESIKVLENYYISVGRLTKQKNFLFLCKAFKKVLNLKKENQDLKLVIAGDGEQRNELENYIIKNKLEKNIELIGHIDNVYPYISKAKGFILTSLWEDPGFVIVEAAFCRTLVLSSNCSTGPIDLLKNNYNGILFESNNSESFVENFEQFKKEINKNVLLLNNMKNIRKFTLFSHYLCLSKIFKKS
jgi:glycosyltransferase involved in cell wall biosynthesis